MAAGCLILLVVLFFPDLGFLLLLGPVLRLLIVPVLRLLVLGRLVLRLHPPGGHAAVLVPAEEQEEGLRDTKQQAEHQIQNLVLGIAGSIHIIQRDIAQDGNCQLHACQRQCQRNNHHHRDKDLFQHILPVHTEYHIVHHFHRNNQRRSNDGQQKNRCDDIQNQKRLIISSRRKISLQILMLLLLLT